MSKDLAACQDHPLRGDQPGRSWNGEYAEKISGSLSSKKNMMQLSHPKRCELLYNNNNCSLFGYSQLLDPLSAIFFFYFYIPDSSVARDTEKGAVATVVSQHFSR